MTTRALRFRKSVQIVEGWARLATQLASSEVPEAREIGRGLAAAAKRERAKYAADAKAGRAPRGHLEDVHWHFQHALRGARVIEGKS